MANTTINENGTIQLNGNISMEIVRDDDDQVTITLYGIEVPDGAYWLDYIEYSIENWFGLEDELTNWLVERGVDSDLTADICALAENIREYGVC